MSASALETPPELDVPIRPDLLPVAEAEADFQQWELHSELVLVDPELRRRSLELLPELTLDAPVRPLRAGPPVPPEPVPEPEPASASLLRYTLRRVGDTIRMGLMIVGAIFLLALLAEVLAH
jgi:hypothetical protein